MGTRYDKDLEKEFKKHGIQWITPFGYVWSDSITEECSKTCTVGEVERVIDKIVDDRLRRFGIAPERI